MSVEEASRKRRSKPPPKERPGVEQRRRAILDAALEVFAESGFSGARMQDVATRAGVAKGTLYLYFQDKAALFEGLVREAIDPVLGAMEDRLATFEGTTADFVSLFFAHMAEQVVQSPRRHIIRLMIREGERFPEMAAFYHREVVSRALRLLRAVNERGLARGEITSEAGVLYPHLFIAPMLMALVWEGLFQRLEPLDARGMLAAHGETLLRGLGWNQEQGGPA